MRSWLMRLSISDACSAFLCRGKLPVKTVHRHVGRDGSGVEEVEEMEQGAGQEHENGNEPETDSPRWHKVKHPAPVASSWKDCGKWMAEQRPRFTRHLVTFYRLHFTYILSLVTIGTFIIWLSPARRRGGKPIPFIDALFNAASAGCVVGLNSVDTEQFSIFQQVVLMFLIILGGHVFTSLLPVLVRRYYFYLYIKQYKQQEISRPRSAVLENGKGKSSLTLKSIKEDKPFKQEASKGDLRSSPPRSPTSVERDLTHTSNRPDKQNSNVHGSTISFAAGDLTVTDSDTTFGSEFKESKDNVNWHVPVDYSIPHSHTWSGESATLAGQRLKMAMALMKMNEHLSRRLPRARDEVSDYGSSVEEQEILDPSELRTIEYRALHVLSWLVPSYIFVIHFVGFLLIFINFAAAPWQQAILNRGSISRTFFAVFQAVSSFQNAGLVLLSSSLGELKKATCLLVAVAALILLGNTMYAPTMRGIIYVLYRVVARKHKEPFKYLLDHPRRCYTHLFPRDTTVWLVITVIAFNVTELAAFCILDWEKPPLRDLSNGYKVLISLFQSLNTRSSGFLVLDLTGISPAMKVLYIIMMYVAVYPVYLSRQSSRESADVYDDLDVGIFEVVNDARGTGIFSQMRQLLAQDSMLLFLGTFIICIVQSHEIESDPVNFTIFNIFFEVISAYGNVGLSMGYKCVSAPDCLSPTYSFVGSWKPVAKFVIIVLMIFGRHRGLPDDIDQAVTIPRRKTFKKGPKRQLHELDDLEFAKLGALNFRLRNFKTSSSTNLLSPQGLLPRVFSGAGASAQAGSPRVVLLPKSESTGQLLPSRPEFTKSSSLPESMQILQRSKTP